jgi:branched-chain amino acid transport system ATP-binding protein
MTTMLSAETIAAGYNASRIVDGVSLTVDTGEVVAVLGPNGSGKSTLIKTIAGLIPLSAGTVTIGAQDVSGLDASARALAGLAYVPQEHNVFREMTVRENLALAHEFLPRARADSTEVMALFPILNDRLAVKAGRLSGGERQMLAFACALMARPKVLLLDEPSAGLSPRYVEEITATIQQVSATGLGVLLIEQNAAAALKIATKAIVLVAGQVRHAGSAAEIAHDESVRKLYLGG